MKRMDWVYELKKAVNRGEIKFSEKDGKVYVENQQGEVAWLNDELASQKFGHTHYLL